MELINQIHAAMQTEPGYMFVDPTEGRELAARGLVELNESIIDDYGGIAARLTPSGIWEVENASGPTRVEPVIEKDIELATKKTDTPAPTGDFAITKGGFVAPARKRGARTSKFPFDTLEIGDSFFVAGKTAENFASTVTAANKRYSEETGETENYNWKGETRTRNVRKAVRKFAVVNEDGGCRVGRVAV